VAIVNYLDTREYEEDVFDPNSYDPDHPARPAYGQRYRGTETCLINYVYCGSCGSWRVTCTRTGGSVWYKRGSIFWAVVMLFVFTMWLQTPKAPGHGAMGMYAVPVVIVAVLSMVPLFLLRDVGRKHHFRCRYCGAEFAHAFPSQTDDNPLAKTEDEARDFHRSHVGEGFRYEGDSHR
jgi:hypothetical protein